MCSGRVRPHSMRSIPWMLVAVAICFVAWVTPPADAIPTTLLHAFTGNPADGYYPEYVTPLVSGSTIYGLMRYGGTSDYGVAFKVNTDGTGYTVIHNFAPIPCRRRRT